MNDKEIQMIEEVEQVFSDLKTMLHLTDDVLIRINDKFFQTIPSTIEKIEEAIRAEEYETIQTLAHSIKGGSASLHYTAISAIAEKMEKNAQKRESDGNRDDLDLLTTEFAAAAQRYSLWKKRREQIN